MTHYLHIAAFKFHRLFAHLHTHTTVATVIDMYAITNMLQDFLSPAKKTYNIPLLFPL